MALRTWIIRSLILAMLALIGVGIWWAQSYVSPEAVRSSLLSTLAEQFPDTDVQVGSAQIRVFGGISVRNLTITQRGSNEPFFQAPTGVIYHDKEQINRGRLTIRKVELESPTLTVVRQPDGRWSLEGLAKPGANATALPTFVVNKATVRLVDPTEKKLPRIVFTDANFTIVNDPAPLFLNLKGSALGTVGEKFATRFSLTARLNRGNGQLSVRTEMPEIAIGPDTAAIFELLEPRYAEQLRKLSGKASIKGEWLQEPGLPHRYDVQIAVREGRFEHSLLPNPLEGIEARATFKNGKLTLEKATAKLGKATLDLTFETRNLPPQRLPEALPVPEGSGIPAKLASRRKTPTDEQLMLSEWEDQLERLNFVLHDLEVQNSLLERLPDDARKILMRFSPAGSVALGYRFLRPTPESWKREFDLRPINLSLNYQKFQYPISAISGLIRQTVTAETQESSLELTGTASGQRVNIKGNIRGLGPDPYMLLKISGTNIPIDDQLFDAFPNKKYPKVMRSLHPSGRADFTVEVKQQAGVNLVENTFRVDLYEGTLNYSQFPYPLEKLKGKLNVYVSTTDPTRPVRPGEEIQPLPETDRFEIRELTASHAGGNIEIKGDNLPIGNSKDRRLTLSVRARDCPLDEHFHNALAALKIGLVWDVLKPRGKLTCAVDVDVIDRATPSRGVPTVGPVPLGKPVTGYEQLQAVVQLPPEPPFDPTTDLKLAFNFTGPSVTPEFFPYRLDDLAGRLTFDGSLVKLEKTSARHGSARWDLNAADIRFYDDGRVWANLGKLDVAPLVVDEAFLTALPKTLREGLKEINLRGPSEFRLNHMVILTSDSQTSAAPADPELYWKGELRLMGASFDAGVACEQAVGKLAVSGRYYPTHLGRVSGNLWLDTVQIAGHPVSAFKATFDAEPQELDPINTGQRLPPAFKITDMYATLFNGTVGGTARVVLSTPTRYSLSLTATDIRLEDVAQFHGLGNGSKLEGAAQGSILLETTRDLNTGQMVLTGYGKADVDRGHIYNLPPLMPLLKALKLQAPDKTAFEEAHAIFTLRGDRVRVDHLDLLGTAISLGGAGEVDMSGKYLKFDFYTIISQTLQRWLTTPFGDVTAMVSEKLFKIEVTRKPDGEIEYQPRVVPFVTDPFKAIAERMRAKTGRQATARAAPGK
jgi:hypothetical protein